MTGDKHYVEAEDMLYAAEHTHADQHFRAYLVAAAQVHATLALAAQLNSGVPVEVVT